MPPIHSQDHFTPKAFGGASAPPQPPAVIFDKDIIKCMNYTQKCQK